MRDAKRTARVFKALSSDARVRILQMLKERSLCVGALASRLNVSSAAVSQHLRILRDAGLVIPDKRSYYLHYRLNRKTLEQWRLLASDLLTPDAQ